MSAVSAWPTAVTGPFALASAPAAGTAAAGGATPHGALATSTSGPPLHAVPSATAAHSQWQQLADAVAARAARQALAAPGVRRARFAVSGTADAPQLSAQVWVRHGGKFSRAVDAVMESVVPEMERSLGHRFTKNQVDFDVIGLCSPRTGAPALSIT